MSVHHTRNLELLISSDLAFDLCIESLQLIQKCAIQNEDRSAGKIVARAGMTWRTWGDVISFEVHRANDDGTEIKVSSRPALGSTLVDFGKNLQNVEQITAFLNARSVRW